MHLIRSHIYDLKVESEQGQTVRGIRWTPISELPGSEQCEDMRQVSSEKILRAGRVLQNAVLSAAPNLMRDRKRHLKTFRQCCTGKELIDLLLKMGPAVQSRPQAVGVWQVLVEEGLLVHARQEQIFQDSHFFRFSESAAANGDGARGEQDSEDDLQEALSLLALHGPEAMLTMILRKAPQQRTAEDLEMIFEELIHIKAVSHLSSTVKRQLAAVLRFESQEKAGTVCESRLSADPRNRTVFGQREKAISTQRLLTRYTDLTIHTSDCCYLWGSCVRTIIAALGGGLRVSRERVLVQLNSAGDQVELGPDDSSVYTSLGLNERLYFCTRDEKRTLVPHAEHRCPTRGTLAALEAISSKDLAQHLTDYDWHLFRSVHEIELIYYSFGKPFPTVGTTANLQRYLRRFNEIQFWAVSEICLCADLGKRALLLKKLIKTAAYCKEQKNMNSFFAIMFGLSNSAVSRLSHTWERIPSKTRRMYQASERLMDPSRNHRVYRLAVSKFSGPFLPFMPLLLKDMTFIQEGNKTFVNNLVNFEKLRMAARAVNVMRQCRSNSLREYALSTISFRLQRRERQNGTLALRGDARVPRREDERPRGGRLTPLSRRSHRLCGRAGRTGCVIRDCFFPPHDLVRRNDPPTNVWSPFQQRQSAQKLTLDALPVDTKLARLSNASDRSVSTRSPQAVRRYVQRLKAIDNQRILSQLSRELEP
ncbi:rap guanine nucleotide exchange factor 3-like [Heptranchias perlo]|uniref:rap guanine nucleotide exchange factor 3-like n=1 Tax=Heptranchias perlo TaxID=212740 RepID=UPI003559D846